jgi:hypothetical protein
MALAVPSSGRSRCRRRSIRRRGSLTFYLRPRRDGRPTAANRVRSMGSSGAVRPAFLGVQPGARWWAPRIRIAYRSRIERLGILILAVVSTHGNDHRAHSKGVLATGCRGRSSVNRSMATERFSPGDVQSYSPVCPLQTRDARRLPMPIGMSGIPVPRRWGAASPTPLWSSS